MVEIEANAYEGIAVTLNNIKMRIKQTGLVSIDIVNDIEKLVGSNFITESIPANKFTTQLSTVNAQLVLEYLDSIKPSKPIRTDIDIALDTTNNISIGLKTLLDTIKMRLQESDILTHIERLDLPEYNKVYVGTELKSVPEISIKEFATSLQIDVRSLDLARKVENGYMFNTADNTETEVYSKMNFLLILLELKDNDVLSGLLSQYRDGTLFLNLAKPFKMKYLKTISSNVVNIENLVNELNDELAVLRYSITKDRQVDKTYSLLLKELNELLKVK